MSKVKKEEYYIENNRDYLTSIYENIDTISDDIKKYYTSIIKCCNTIKESIKAFIEWLNSNKISNLSDEHYSNILKYLNILKDFNSESFNHYKKNSNLIYDNLKLFDNLLNSSVNNLKETVNSGSSSDMIENPNIIHEPISGYKYYEEESEKGENEEENEMKFKCSLCGDIASFLYKNEFFCQKCQQEKLNNDDIDIINLDMIISDKKWQKEIFLTSISNIFKRVLLLADKFFKKEVIKLHSIDNKADKLTIIRGFDYPFIKDENNNLQYIQFFKEIDSLFLKEFGKVQISNKDFKVSKLDKSLVKIINNTFSDEFLKTFYNQLDLIDDLYSSETSFEKSEQNISINTTKIQIPSFSMKQFSQYFNFIYKQKREKEGKKADENSYTKGYKINFSNNKSLAKILVKKDQKKYLNIFQFYYLINCIYKRDSYFERINNLEEEIIKVLKFHLLYNKKNTSIKYIFSYFFITTEKFSNMPLEEIIFDFPEMYEIYEIKIIIDNLLDKQCQIKNYIDYNCNIFNSGKGFRIKGIERFNSEIPEGWFGIGIKIDNKYNNNSEWKNSYFAFGENLNSTQFMDKLKEIIVKGLEKEVLVNKNPNENKSNFDIDKNAYINYLGGKINYIEKHSGTISLYNNIYRILLSVKINIRKIRESEDKKFLLLNNESMKINLILFKKINS